MDPYKILEIDAHATLEEIQRAYRSKALKHHPDHGGDGWAFQQVRDAYAQLVKIHQTRPQSKDGVATAGPVSELTRQTPPTPSPAPPPDSRGAAGQARWWQFAFRDLPLQNETTIFILVNVLDIFVTYVLLRFGGIEANPVARFFLDRWNFAGVVFFKMTMVAFVTVLAQIICQRSPSAARRLMQAGTVIVGCVVIYGLFLLARHAF